MSVSTLFSNRRFARLMLAGSLCVPALSANADDFALQNNQIVISAPGFSQSATVDGNGVLSTVAGIPKTSGLGIPSLSFTLAANGTLTNGTYSFRVGVTLDDDNSARRVEASISRIDVVVAGNGTSIVSSIPAGTPLSVLGTEGSYILSMTDTNPSTGGPISVSGGTITFSADNLINQIKKSNAAFEPILDTFAGSAHYTYRIIAQQTSYTPSTARFGTLTSATFTPLPRIGTTCVAKSSGVFLLSRVIADSFTAAYALQGRFSIIGASGSPAAAPAPFAGTCTTGNTGGSGGGGGGGGQTTVAQQTTTLLTNLNAISIPSSGTLSAALLTTINAAITQADSLSSLAVLQVNANTLATAAAISTLETLGVNLELVGRTRQRGGSIGQEVALESVANLSALVSALASSRVLSGAEQQQINAIVLNALDDVADLIISTSSNANLEATIDAAAQLVEASFSAGTTLTSALADVTGALTHTAILRGIPSLASSFGITLSAANTAQLRSGIQNNPALLERALRYSIPLDKSPDKASLITQLTSRGVSPVDAERVATSIAATSTTLARVGIDGQPTQSVLDDIAVALSGNSASFDSTTALLTVSGSGATEYFIITTARVVPDSVPEGRIALPDGRIVAIRDGLAFELAPASRNVLEFASVVEGAGFDINFTATGSIDIALSPTEHFSGAFAFNTPPHASDACEQIGVTYPTGNPAGALYAFEIKCDNGPTQRILPFIGNDIFYAVGTQAALKITTDRNSGVVTVPGIGLFKPSFFTYAPTSADLLFLQQNELGQGLSFRLGDLNGDGLTDFEMIDANSKQILYGLPQ